MKNTITITLITISLLGFTLTACKKDAASTEENTETSQAADNKNPGALSMEQIQALAANCNSFDLIFHDYPISSSGPDNAACRNVISFVGLETTPIDSRSKSLGRYFFKDDQAVEIMAAEVYFDQYTKALQFITKDNKTYVNRMSLQGAEYFEYFLKQIEAQFNEQAKQQQQQ